MSRYFDSDCSLCESIDSCPFRPETGSKPVILIKPQEVVVRGERRADRTRKIGRWIRGLCYDAQMEVRHDISHIPEWSDKEKGIVGVHDLRIKYGLVNPEVFDLESSFDAPKAYPEITNAMIELWRESN